MRAVVVYESLSGNTPQDRGGDRGRYPGFRRNLSTLPCPRPEHRLAQSSLLRKRTTEGAAFEAAPSCFGTLR